MRIHVNDHYIGGLATDSEGRSKRGTFSELMGRPCSVLPGQLITALILPRLLRSPLSAVSSGYIVVIGTCTSVTRNLKCIEYALVGTCSFDSHVFSSKTFCINNFNRHIEIMYISHILNHKQTNLLQSFKGPPCVVK